MYDYTLHIKLMEIIPSKPFPQKRFLFTCVIIIYFYPRLHFNFLEISCRSNFGCSKLMDKAISKDLYRTI